MTNKNKEEKLLKVLIWKGTIKEMREHPLYRTGRREAQQEYLGSLYSELSTFINTLEDDLTLDLDKGENGCKSYEESYNAVKKYTLRLLKKRAKHTKQKLSLFSPKGLKGLSKLHNDSHQEISDKDKVQSSYGELARVSMQRKPKQQHNPAGNNSQNGRTKNTGR